MNRHRLFLLSLLLGVPSGIAFTGVVLESSRAVGEEPDLFASPPRSSAFNVRSYGAKGDSIADDTDAIQACIDAALGSADSKTKVREAKGPIYLPSGKYKITRPLKIYSAQYVKFHGDGGSSQLYPVGKMTSVLDLNGVAYSTFNDFLIRGNGRDESIDDAILHYWDPATAYRSSTRNVFEKIIIQNTRCVTAIRIGKPKSGLQVDQGVYRDISIEGAWKPGETTWYQAGLYIGDGLFANNLIHSAYNLESSFWASGVTVDASNFSLFGGGLGRNGTDLNAHTLAYFSVQGLRSESSGRFFESIGPSSHDALYNLSDIIWSADKIVDDGEFIRMRANGVLSLQNLQITNGGAKAKIAANPVLSSTIRLAGIVSPNTLDGFLSTLNAKATAIVEGYYQANTTVGRVAAIDGFSTTGPVQWPGPGGGGIWMRSGGFYSQPGKGKATTLIKPRR
ncbi:glycosyl hydrolase family 28-related protein [Singulisphaera sp. Ch08]|uniref:Glycosyl hydrolase family 28-related protein n=1 Tax=Singulisphaera sp. Ch08 TaxID=3120278 RepID=A0AAU7CMF7_9BACT